MARQREKTQSCNAASDIIIKTCLECLEKNCENIAIYVDYNPLHHPVVTTYSVLLLSENMPQELGDFVGEVIVEFTTSLETLLKLGSFSGNILEFISELRVRCTTGWIVYGYTSARSQYGVPYMTKLWMYIPASRLETTVIQLSEDELKTIHKLLSIAAEKARKVIELEIM